MQHYDQPGLVNVGTGEDIEIGELVMLIKEIIGYSGDILHDLNKPDGTPRKLMDVSKLHSFGWKHRINLRDGIRLVYDEYCQTESIRTKDL
jgi:GDP-L-fucose synthase